MFHGGMHRHHNTLKTLLLFAGIIVVLVGVGYVLTASSGDTTYLVLFSLMGLVTTAVGYWNSDKVALRAMKAIPVSPQEAPAMYAIVSDLALRFRMPMPRLYVAPTDAPNAFATGRNPKNSAVCCTTGILALLDERELRGVLAHELSHVANRDILTASVAAALANVVTTVGQMLSFGTLYGGRTGSRNPFAMIVAALVAPFAAMIMRMAISRTREYDADADGAHITGDPMGLASALGKLHHVTQRVPLRPTRRLETVSSMMILNPFGPLSSGELFSTHPPVAERIRRLTQLAVELGQWDPRSGTQLGGGRPGPAIW